MKEAPGDLEGVRAVVVGLGTFGGGTGVVRFLASRGARVLVTDLRGPDELRESLAGLSDLGVRFRLGEHREEDVREADLVVLGPAVPPDAPIARAARAGPAVCTSPMNLLWKRLPARPIGVTGTRGKTTTAVMLHAMLARRWPDAVLGGNVGGSLLPRVGAISRTAPVVLELSSYQLHWLREIRASPRIAVVTNISPHHLEWHGSMAAYEKAKRTILEFQGDGDVAVLNADDGSLRGWAPSCRGRTLWFSASGAPEADARIRGRRVEVRVSGRHEPWLDLDEIPLRGGFHAENVMAAALAAAAMGMRDEEVRPAVRGLRPLPHRLETIATHRGVSYVNDSKATTPAAAAAGIESLEGPILWIGGGKEAGEDLAPIARAAAGRVRKAFLIGEAAGRLARDLAGAVPEREVCESLRRAVEGAGREAVAGETVLFSPGCASFDLFLNYERRGEAFGECVRSLTGAPGRGAPRPPEGRRGDARAGLP